MLGSTASDDRQQDDLAQCSDVCAHYCSSLQYGLPRSILQETGPAPLSDLPIMPIRLIVLVMAVALLGACALLSPQKNTDWMVSTFMQRLNSLAGEDARDCGAFFAFDGEGAEQMDCANAAIASGKPFRVYCRVRGIDSVIFRGMAGNSRGELFVVIGDTDASGGSAMRPKPSVNAFACGKQRVQLESADCFDCDPRTEIP